jgi:hypothetical protein
MKSPHQVPRSGNPIPYAEAEAALLKLVPRQLTTLYGHMVHRCADGRHWTIDDSSSLMLLRAIDALRGGFPRSGTADGAGGTGDA